MDCSLPGSSVHGDSPGKNAGVGCHVLFQGNFLTQELNWDLLHCRWILYQLSYREGHYIIETKLRRKRGRNVRKDRPGLMHS